MELIKLRERPELVHKAARWFQHTFGIPEGVYLESMEEMLRGDCPGAFGDGMYGYGGAWD